MGLLSWFQQNADVNISNIDLGNAHFRREAANALNITPLKLARATPEYLQENSAVLKTVWNRIQDDVADKRDNADLSALYELQARRRPRKAPIQNCHCTGVTFACMAGFGLAYLILK